MLDDATRCDAVPKTPFLETQLKAMPPRNGPCPAGKRRPRPGSLNRCTPRSRGACCDDDQAPAATEEELNRLRGLVAELTARCDQQREDLEALQVLQPSKPSMRTTEVQTALPAGSISTSSSTDAGAHEEATLAEEQRGQLDRLHREVGDKTRELRRSQDTVRLLRSELKQQQQVSEQYQAQADMLEEQLRIIHQRKMGTQLGDRSRPASAKMSRERQVGSQHLVAPALPEMVMRPFCNEAGAQAVQMREDADSGGSDSDEQGEVILAPL
mmetsp:Transcript_73852/g.130469  ORF Transcript_73852/g.130469 Transcript_73852/m.130469 type:complete len:270 (+) Transcript_73852:35-844(+)